MITHVLRYDDFSECSSTVVEERLIALLIKHRMPCTFGVVPFACDPDSLLRGGEVSLKSLSQEKAGLLQPLIKEGLAEVALHGYSHLTLAPVRGYQEFSQRMPAETQRDLIRRGRDLLENLFQTRVTLYVPPWNHLSPATAEVLASEGMSLSGDILGFESGASLKLPQFPCTAGIQETASLLKMACRFRGDHGIGTVFHDYDFQESGLGVGNLTMQKFDHILTEWKSQAEIHQALISQSLAKESEGSGRAKANATLRNRYQKSRLGRRLLPLANKVYWSDATANRIGNILNFLP
jgi:hypothetical protein